jgi:hypothetical protein
MQKYGKSSSAALCKNQAFSAVSPYTASKAARLCGIGGNSTELFRDWMRVSAFAAISPPGF